jgi:hypothetical protein
LFGDPARQSIRRQITADDRRIDPIEEGYDVVIRGDPPADSDLVGLCIVHHRAVDRGAPIDAPLRSPACRFGLSSPTHKRMMCGRY